MPWVRNPAELVQRATPSMLSRAVSECSHFGCLTWMRANKPIVFMVAYVSGFLIVGTLSFMSLEGWTFTESLYFNIITMSTVGYGDFFPSTLGSKVFSVFHASAGLAVFTIILGARIRTVEDQNTVLERHTRIQESLQGGPHIQEKPSRFWQSASRLLFIYLCMLGVGTMFYALALNYEFYESMYLATVTGTSIGYGDVVPSQTASGDKSYGGMWFSVFYVVVFFGFTAHLLGWIASQLFAHGIRRDIESSLRGSLSQRLLRVLDTNNDNVVDRAEWMRAVLVANEVCSQDLLDSISRRFDELDVDKSGTLTTRDLSPFLAGTESSESCNGDELSHTLTRVHTVREKSGDDGTSAARYVEPTTPGVIEEERYTTATTAIDQQQGQEQGQDGQDGQEEEKGTAEP